MDQFLEVGYSRVADEFDAPVVPETRIAIELFFACVVTCLFVTILVGTAVYSSLDTAEAAQIEDAVVTFGN